MLALVDEDVVDQVQQLAGADLEGAFVADLALEGGGEGLAGFDDAAA